MSAALLDLPLAPGTTVVGALPRRSRTSLPVGARFPRRVTADLAQSTGLAAATTASASTAPIFPIGARFPRRSAADILTYLAEMELRHEPVAPRRPRYPVGARFPLR